MFKRSQVFKNSPDMILLVIVTLFLCQVLAYPIFGSWTSEIPRLVSIQSGGYHKCGGSIVSRTTILTAAHCAKYPINSYKVRVGSSRTDSGGMHHEVVAIKQHENYNVTADSVMYDVALMKVVPHIELSKNVNLIQLANNGYAIPEHTEVRFMGWGSTSERGTPTNELRSVNLHIVESSECSRLYGDTTGIGMQVRHLICASGIDSGTCYGDSGGPLVFENIQVGILFGANGCDAHRYPGVYQNVAQYRNWIDENLKNL